MIGHAMREAARELLRGEISFDRFLRKSRPDWQRLAAWLYRKWPTPEAVTVEDVEQELYLQATRAWQRGFDPTRSSDLAKYLVFVARDKTTTWLHGQRGARMHGSPATRPSQIAIPASRLDNPETGASWLDGVSGENRAADERAKARQQANAIVSLCGPVEARIVDALLDADGDVAVAAATLYADGEYRLEHWLVGDRSAYRHVERALGRIREKVDAATRIPVSGLASAG